MIGCYNETKSFGKKRAAAFLIYIHLNVFLKSLTVMTVLSQLACVIILNNTFGGLKGA